MRFEEINEDQYIEDYSSDILRKELANKYGADISTIDRWNQQLREEGEIEYRNKKKSSKYLRKIKNQEKQESSYQINNQMSKDGRPIIRRPGGYGDANLTKSELLKLLNLHGSKSEVARNLKVSTRSITHACKRFNIITDEDKVIELVNILQTINEEQVEPYENFTHNNKSKESFNLALSDAHGGKEINRSDNVFNLKALEDRFNKLNKNILNLLTRHIQYSADIGHVNIFLLGDHVDGSGIYQGQEYQQVSSLPEQITVLYNLLRKLFISFIDKGYSVRVYGVKGNHGGIDDNPMNNFDILLYMLLENWKNTQKIDNFSIEYSTENSFDVEIDGWKYHLSHKAYKQGKTSAGARKYLGWSKNHDSDAVVSGHFHTPRYEEVNTIDVFQNGCLCGPDDFSDKLAVSAKPCQIVWGTTPKRLMTFFYRVDLK